MNEALAPAVTPVVAPQAFSLTIEKFTKQNVYDLLIGIAQGKSPVNFGDEESLKLFTNIVEVNFKPQSGGGKSEHPSHVDPTLQVMVHWCRFLQKYMIEEDMVMSGGKSKGASKLASKHNYELGKQAQKLKDEALLLFGAQDYAAGAEKNTQAGEIEASRSKKETYTDAVLAQYLPEPKEEVPQTIGQVAAAGVQSIEQGVPVIPEVPVVPIVAQPAVAEVAPIAQPPVGTLLGHDGNGQPVYQQ